MNKQTVLFDLDDTLIHCNKYFDLVLDEFTATLAEWFNDYGLLAEEIRKKQVEIDIAEVEKKGFAKEHFPKSLIRTYDHYSDLYKRTVNIREVELLEQLGYSVYEMEIEAYPHMSDTLVKMKEDGHQLYLYTGGDALVQQKKVERMGLRDFFGDRIFIRRHKNIQALADIVAHAKFNPQDTWMVGNSIRTDIIPALHAGIHAVHIPAITEWAFNEVPIEVEPRGLFLTLESLRELPETIRLHSSTK